MRRNPHASPIKEKRVSVFQLQTFSQDSEQWAFGAVSKVGYFFDSPPSLKLSLYIART